MAVLGGTLFLFLIFTIFFVNSQILNYGGKFKELSDESCRDMRQLLLSPGEKKYLIGFHNSLRKNISKNIEDFPKEIKWDKDLAKMAQDWAINCSDREDEGLNKSIGQYIITSFGSSGKAKLRDMLQAWAAKVSLLSGHMAKNQKPKENRYEDQILWWNAEHFGCGRSVYKQGCKDANCTELNRMVKLVCNYFPVGSERERGYVDPPPQKCGGRNECTTEGSKKRKEEEVGKKKSKGEYRFRSRTVELWPAAGNQGNCWQSSNILCIYLSTFLAVLSNLNLLKLI